MNNIDIEIAKKRIWNRMKNKLPDRGISVFAEEVSSLRTQAEISKISVLKKVQSKERLLDLLPDRPSREFPIFAPRKIFAAVSLMAVFSIFLIPVLRFSPTASAVKENTIQIVEGEVYVNGQAVSENATVAEGDKITTGYGSMAHITFVDDSRLTVGPDSEIDLSKIFVDGNNRALTQIAVSQESGRAFVQVLNLVSDGSYFELDFPSGKVSTTQKASFDVNFVDDSVQVSVARNLVNAEVSLEDTSYTGVLGQGAIMTVADSVKTDVISDDFAKNDVWWTFNLAYGKSYARLLDENYKSENIKRAIILPGDPFYFLKTFRETVQVSLALTASARTDLLVEQAENRLNEAQTLIAKGDTELAKQTLDIYQRTVDSAIISGGEESNEAILALRDETNKEVLVSPVGDEGAQILQDQLSDTSLEGSMDSASQKLQQVPELIDAGQMEDALAILAAYQDESLSLLTQLQDVPMDERDAVVSQILDKKLSDLQLLRVIAGMPNFNNGTGDSANGTGDTAGTAVVNDTILNQLSVMVLSLRERELKDLTEFFNGNTNVSYDLYVRLKDSANMTSDLSDQFDTVEEQLVDSAGTAVVVADMQEVSDPRFSGTHTDETQDQTDSGN